MKVCVLGLWHLGTVTAACLAAAGHTVVGLDFEAETVQRLQAGQPPIFEPDLETLVQHGLASGRLRFTTHSDTALAGAEVVWVTYDTPIDEDDRADVAFVVDRVTRLFPALPTGVLVLISSQLPVGTTRRLAQAYAEAQPHRSVTFAYCPENLRLGKALQTFRQPDRIIVGIQEAQKAMAQQRVRDLLQPLTDRIEWMSIESAEMTKHALNAFLATSITFMNEVATVCEHVGADAKEVERGLKTEARIGPRAYLGPGAAFGGGTLARDIRFLSQVGKEYQQPMHLLSAVYTSNTVHKQWVRQTLQRLLGDWFGDRLGQTVSIWGLAYKPGTDSVRRSGGLELCRWLVQHGVQVHAHDPAVSVLPPELAQQCVLAATPQAALQGATALVVATEWPEYRSVTADSLVAAMANPLVLDPNRFLENTLGNDSRIRYAAVGKVSSQ